MRILGIDPGFAIVGWGIVDYVGSRFKIVAYGSIQTPAGQRLEERLKTIYSDLGGVIDKFKPDVMAVEELFFNTNITTGIKVAQARGVILLCAEQRGIPMAEYTPLQVKQSVVGYGRAVKKQVMHMVELLMKLENAPKLDDTCDARAIAICHANTGN